MKRIVFLLLKQPEAEVKSEYCDYLNEAGVNYLYLDAKSEEAKAFVPEYEDVVCTDSCEIYKNLLEHGEQSIVAISHEETFTTSEAISHEKTFTTSEAISHEETSTTSEAISDGETATISVAINNAQTVNAFEGARYVLWDSQDTEVEYYDKIWHRFRDLPWLIKETERLIIRETTVEDVDSFVELYKDPCMTRFTEALYEDIEEERKYAREYIEKVYKVQGFGIWTLIDRESGTIIGRAGIVCREGFDGVEIGYSIGVAFQNKGYATEAVMACLEICKELELEPVRVLTMAENISSIRVLEKCNFIKCGQVSINYTDYDEYIWQDEFSM